MDRICIITSGYPTPKSPAQYAFVDQLACAMADLGKQIDVICPIPLGRQKARGYIGRDWERKTNQGNVIRVHQPLIMSYTSKVLGPLDLGKLSEHSFFAAVRKTLRKLPRPDVLYSHFLSPAGLAAARLGKEFGIPAFSAFGESGLWSIEHLGLETAAELLQDLSGIISVSSENKRLLIENRLFPAERIGVFPNGADHSVFRPLDKAECRKALGLPQDAVIGMFTGGFIERKGPLRVQQAALRIPELKMIYAGTGEQEPAGENILFKGRIPHDELPKYLSAADFFVLPTQVEGCCNAIVEAMACGLPVVSSTGSFNDDILNDQNSLRVDAMDVEALYQAMRRMTTDAELRQTLRQGAAKMTEQLDITQRAANILRFMEMS